MKNILTFGCLLAFTFVQTADARAGRDWSQMNVGVNAFIIGERLLLAKRLLVHTDLTVAEIAARCGFGSNKYMTGMFKRKLGETPTEYRAGNR